ncbi:MAG: pantoate--beta-alanine ligase [Verrucomicrobiae bacterium]|nr:pantoate--beta-alanine ligase [Verrucomicrobiae bacterium]
MQVLRSIAAMQRLARGWRGGGARIGFVPTMGYLHEGHLSLIRAARRRVGATGKVVVSIYVNPTQFAPHEDLARYPRDLKRDLALCRSEKVDVVFAPSDAAMYPGRESGDYSAYVVETLLSQRMEGASRPMHFRGVTTVVAKLFNMVLPDLAVFGAKDWQQAVIIKRMVADLNFPIRIVAAPIVREPDGLARSSRNKYLTGDLRAQALVLSRSIAEVRKLVATARAVPAARLRQLVKRVVASAPDARLDYVEFFDPETLTPRKRVESGTHMALAVWVGQTRLIDNGRL